MEGTEGAGAEPAGIEAPQSTEPLEVEGDGLEGVEAEPAVEKRRHKVKIDGEEVEVDDDTLLRDYQLAKASHKRMQEAAETRKQAEEQIAQIRALAEQTRQDPRNLFKALGLDAKQFAEALLAEELENELLSPEEKELRELRNWKKQNEMERAEKEEAEKKRKAEELALQAGAEIESEIVDALKVSGIKATPRSVARVAEMMLASLGGDGPRLKASDAISRLTPEYRADVVDLLESMEPGTLETEYPSLYKKILNHASTKNSAVPTFKRGIGQQSSAAKSSKPKSWEDWLPD